jgi:hypothetical protein
MLSNGLSDDLGTIQSVRFERQRTRVALLKRLLLFPTPEHPTVDPIKIHLGLSHLVDIALKCFT